MPPGARRPAEAGRPARRDTGARRSDTEERRQSIGQDHRHRDEIERFGDASLGDLLAPAGRHDRRTPGAAAYACAGSAAATADPARRRAAGGLSLTRSTPRWSSASRFSGADCRDRRAGDRRHDQHHHREGFRKQLNDLKPRRRRTASSRRA
jgi:hypothetical protein